jgi:septal ring factor EnvC (AmiA/AmiB activator)
MPVMETPFAMYDALTSIEVPPEKVRVVVKSMESDMALFATSTQFNQLDQYSGSRFDMLRAEIAASRERVELVDKRFEQVHAEIAAVREQLSDKFQLLQSAMLAVGKSVDDLSRNLENRLLVRVAVMLGGTVLFLGGLMALLKG